MKWLFKIGLFFILAEVSAQSKGNLSGWVIDKNTQKPIAGVSVKLVNTIYSTFTDTTGKYNFKAIPTGQYQIKFTSLGSAPLTLFNVIVSTGNETNNTIELITESVQLTTVQVGSNKKTVRVATLETPLSVQRLTAEEIKAT